MKALTTDDLRADADTERQPPARTLLTLHDIAQRIGVSRPRLWSIRRDDPRFPAPVYLGKSQRFRLDEIEEWERGLPRERAA